MTEGVCAATLLLSAQVNPETPPVFELFSACCFFVFFFKKVYMLKLYIFAHAEKNLLFFVLS